MVGTLERTGELDNTLIVFTSDNGYMHGEHRAQGEKVLLYEESIRVPLVMRGPGIPRNWADPRPVANIDVVPTIVDAAGATAERTLDGRSLLDLEDDRGVWLGRDILIENGNGANNVPAYRALRTNGFLYAEHRTTGEYELYDLKRDPYQLRSVDGQARYAAIERDMAQRLRLLKNCAGRGCQKRPALKLGLRSRAGPSSTEAARAATCARGSAGATAAGSWVRSSRSRAAGWRASRPRARSRSGSVSRACRGAGAIWCACAPSCATAASSRSIAG